MVPFAARAVRQVNPRSPVPTGGQRAVEIGEMDGMELATGHAPGAGGW
jgi:hypothetical protein